METFEQLFEETLKDIYYAEKAILKALPKMDKKATSRKLQTAFTKHESETEKQVERLDQVFDLLGKRASGKKCPAIDGIIEEASEVMKEAEGTTRCAMQPCWRPHSPSSTTKSPATAPWWHGPQKMNMGKVEKLLQATLDEEKATDAKLTELADMEINIAAEEGDAEEAAPRRRAGGRR